MKKRIFSLILTLALCLSLSVPAFAAGSFRDVEQNAWYAKYLDTAVNSGLISGRGDGRFAPNDAITGAEAVKIAACLGQLLSEGYVSLTSGSPWYAPFEDYALRHGILDVRLDQYLVDDAIVRAEVMDMICRAIPVSQRNEINSIPDGAIPDIYPFADYRDNVYTLYRMGIVAGADDYGSCLPENPISRAEVAALVARVIDSRLRVSFSLKAVDPMGFKNESEMRAALEGEWYYYPPNSNTVGATVAFSRDGSLHMRVIDPQNNAIWEYDGYYELERWYAGANEAPDIINLHLTTGMDGEPTIPCPADGGDYMIIQSTVCEGEAILALLQVNNGDSILSVCYDDWAPILRKSVEWVVQGVPRKGETFTAAVWKVDSIARMVWLDDWSSAGHNTGRHEAVPYSVAPQLEMDTLPTWLMKNGTVWNIRTDATGKVVQMDPPIYENDDMLTEEEASEILSGVYEVQQYLQQGMVMFFEGSTEVIYDQLCVVIALGTDHEEYFVRELFYAVSPNGTVYKYDPFTDYWYMV